jgi:hypothetical protein
VFSPDGKSSRFCATVASLRVVDLTSKQERAWRRPRLQTRWTSRVRRGTATAAGSRCSRLARKAFTNVSLVPISGGTPRPVSYLANVFANTIAWGRDGSYVLFDSGQRTEPGQLVRVDSDAADAEVPRGPVPRSVRGARAQSGEARARHARRSRHDAAISARRAGDACGTRARDAGRTGLVRPRHQGRS